MLRNDVWVILPADVPHGVRAWSDEWQGSRDVVQHELPDGRLQIELPPFQVYCALELRGA